MSYPARRTGRSRHPAANAITLPRRSGGRPSGPAEQPASFPEHVREILQRAADDLTPADAALQPLPGAPGRRGGLGGGDPIVPGVRDLPGHAERVAETRGGTRITVRLLGCFRVCRAGQEVARSAFGGRPAQQLLQILLTDRGQLVPRMS